MNHGYISWFDFFLSKNSVRYITDVVVTYMINVGHARAVSEPKANGSKMVVLKVGAQTAVTFYCLLDMISGYAGF